MKGQQFFFCRSQMAENTTLNRSRSDFGSDLGYVCSLQHDVAARATLTLGFIACNKSLCHTPTWIKQNRLSSVPFSVLATLSDNKRPSMLHRSIGSKKNLKGPTQTHRYNVAKPATLALAFSLRGISLFDCCLYSWLSGKDKGKMNTNSKTVHVHMFFSVLVSIARTYITQSPRQSSAK